VPVVAHVAPAVEPLQLLAPTVAGALYALRVRALARQGRAVPAWRVACFARASCSACSGSPALGHLGEERFSAHMAEHLLLGDVGALLIVLGLTGPVLAPALRLRGLRWLRALAHPVPALTLWALNLFAWHLAVLHEAALEHASVHALQHAAFVALGVNMWMPLFGPLPMPGWFGNWPSSATSSACACSARCWPTSCCGPRRRCTTATRSPTGGRPVGRRLADDGRGVAADARLLGWLFLQRGATARSARRSSSSAPTEARAARAVAAGRGAELRERYDHDGFTGGPRPGDEHREPYPRRERPGAFPPMSPSLMSKVAQLARIPQGRRMAETADAPRARSQDPPAGRAGPRAPDAARRRRPAALAQRDAQQLLELRDRLVRRSCGGPSPCRAPSRLEVAAEVVDEDARLGRQPDLLAPST
jgi:hypothetical protein